MTRRPARGDDSGATLILALIIVTVIAVVLSALLSFADTSLRTTVQLRDQASATYDADGAVQAAINNIRKSTYNASIGQSCFGSTNTLSLPNFYGSDSAAVTCGADPTKVLIQCPSLSQCNRPGNAILSLGKVAGEDGLNIQQNTNSTFLVHGNIFSNSNINVVNGTLKTNSRAYARGACAGTIQSGLGTACNYGNTANALGNDPGYAAATSTVPAHQNVPSCSANGSLVTFQPGYYDDANALSGLMDGSGCKNSTWWFKPGTYYFDFHNSGANANPRLNSNGGNVWTIKSGYLVAGTPTNTSGAIISQPPVPASIPGSCDNPINDPGATGVQFIFGGDSRLVVSSGQVEICGTYSATKPPVAVYGVSSGAGEQQTNLTGSSALKLTSVPVQGGFNPTTAAQLSTVDGTFGSWRSNKTNDSTTLTVSGFAPSTAIPTGSVLTSATLKVTHRHSSTTGSESLSATLTPTGQAAAPAVSVTGAAGGTAWQTDSFALDTSATGPLFSALYATGFTGASVALTANLQRNNDIEDIDAIQLELSYIAPAFRPATGCVTATPYTGTGSSACAQILTQNGSGNQFYIQGTTYEPAAAVDITLNNAAEQVFRFGVIARSVWVKETGSFAYTGPVIEVPDDSPGFVFSVYLSAYLCPGASSCTPTGNPVLVAKVAFVDADPTTPVAGQRQVTILSWSRGS